MFSNKILRQAASPLAPGLLLRPINRCYTKYTMNPTPALFALALATFATAYSQSIDPGEKTNPEVNTTQTKLPEPSPRHRIEVKPGNEDDLETFILKPVTVKSRDEYFIFDHEKRIIFDKPFSWKDGGILSENHGEHATTKLGIQYDARNKGVRFLSISF